MSEAGRSRFNQTIDEACDAIDAAIASVENNLLGVLRRSCRTYEDADRVMRHVERLYCQTPRGEAQAGVARKVLSVLEKEKSRQLMVGSSLTSDPFD